MHEINIFFIISIPVITIHTTARTGTLNVRADSVSFVENS